MLVSCATGQACGVPFDPVYIDRQTGAWSAPGFNYMEKRADWQKWLDEKHNKKDYLDSTAAQAAQGAGGGAAEAAAAATAAVVAADESPQLPEN